MNKIKCSIQSVVKQCINIGTNSSDLFDNRRVLVINVAALMAISSSLAYIILYAANNLWMAVWSNTVVLFGYFGVIVLNYYRNNRFSALLLLCTATLQILSLSVFILGVESGTQYYLLVVIAISFLVTLKKDKALVISIIIITSGIFIFAEYSTWQSSFITPPSPYVAKILHFSSTLGMISIITVVVLTFYISFNNAQKSLEIERQRSEKLLLNILPIAIAQQLKDQHIDIAEDLEKATILFADIVGFTTFAETLPPKQLVTLLNRVFSLFDHLVEKHHVEKIKTIGDAYMVAGGLPLPREDDVEAIANLALDMQKILRQFNKENNQTFEIRIGIHTGSVVAGVIGTKKFAYDVWGDTVNTASRMESHGIAGQIQVSEQSYEYLKHQYTFKDRGAINIKGKGEMKVYLLQGSNEDVRNKLLE